MAEVAKPLSDLTSGKKPFRWGVVKGTFGTFGTAKSLALDEILG